MRIGIDLGGTKIEGLALREDGTEVGPVLAGVAVGTNVSPSAVG